MSKTTATPAAFLDRDGVINLDHGYVSDWDNFDLYPGVIEAMGRLQAAGFRLVIVTNQSGIGRGYYSEQDFWTLMQRFQDCLQEHGIELAGVYFCPHHPDKALPEFRRDCDCRKPAPGMLLRAARELHLSLSDSILVGDKASDMEAGRRAGVGQLFYVSGGAEACEGAHTVTSLAAVPDLIQNS